MKRIIAIAFVLIILLNTMGYYGVFVSMHYQNDLAMSKALDADHYDPSQTLTLRVAVSLPYMPDQSSYERIDGQFEHQGELYRLVKQRYAKDTLTVVCVRDTEHKKIDRALADYVNTFTDQATDTKRSSKLAITFLKDYLPIAFIMSTANPGWALELSHNTCDCRLRSTFLASIIHPPEQA